MSKASWSDIDKWGERDPDTGAFLSIPEGIEQGDIGVMLVEPVGRTPVSQLFVVDVNHDTRWTEDGVYKAGTRLLVRCDEGMFDVEGDPSALRCPVVLDRRSASVVGWWPVPGGAAVDAKTAAGNVQPVEPAATDAEPVHRTDCNGIIDRPGGVTRWLNIRCPWCDQSTPASSASLGERIVEERAAWKTYRLVHPVDCLHCAKSRFVTVSERIADGIEERRHG